MRVLFITKYGMLAASSRTRVFQYLPFLEGEGFESRVLTVLPDRAIGGSQTLVTRNRWRKILYYLWAAYRTAWCGWRAWAMAAAHDVLFVQKVIFPAPVRWLMRWRRSAVVFDFDDAIFTTELRDGNWLSRWKQRRNSAGLPAMLALADLAIVENEYTAGYARQHCRRVATITGPIDTERFHAPKEAHCGGDQVVLGWIGSATTIPYLDLLKPALVKLADRYPHLRLRVVGADRVAIEGIEVEAAAWDMEREVEELQGFDVGLMPIPDDPWTRGKGGYKLLQYMATGLPVVTSPVGINQRLVAHGEVGFWALDAVEWEEGLARLIENPELRHRMGRRGRERVEAEYALDISSVKLARLLREVGGT